MSTEEILSRYARAAEIVFPAVYTPSCCLNGTAVFLHVAEVFKIPARPIVVKATACNRVFYELLQKGGPALVQKESERRKHKRSRHWPQCVQIDDTALLTPDGWPGHLVAIAADRFLVDSSSGAFNRPKKRILVPPVFIGEVGNFLPGHDFSFVHEETGTAIIYTGTERQDFRDAAGFTNPTNRTVAAKVIAIMEGLTA